MPITTEVAHPVVGARPARDPAVPAPPPVGLGPAPPPARIGLAVLTIALMPFPIVLRAWGNPKLPYDYVTMVFPVDVALAGLLVAGLGPLGRRLRSRQAGAGMALWILFAAVMTVAWAVHPSSRGLHTVFELWGTAVLAGTVAEALAGAFSGLVLGALGIVAVIESAWAATQLVRGSGLGLTGLGEDLHPLWPFSASVVGPMGSMVHPYVLAGLALVASAALAWRATSATRPAPWLGAAALAAAPVGYTFSRAGLVGIVFLSGGFAAAALRPSQQRSRCVAAALALCIGTAVPAAVWNNGWLSRASQTTSATNAGALTTERTQLVHESLVLLGTNPLAGIGPGQYVPALQRHFKVESDKRIANFRPVHNVILLVGAEGGVAALLVMVAFFLVVGWRALRAGPIATGVYLAYLPFCMLDHFPYSFPQGLVLTACWLGLLDVIGRKRTPTGAEAVSEPLPAPV